MVGSAVCCSPSLSRSAKKHRSGRKSLLPVHFLPQMPQTASRNVLPRSVQIIFFCPVCKLPFFSVLRQSVYHSIQPDSSNKASGLYGNTDIQPLPAVTGKVFPSSAKRGLPSVDISLQLSYITNWLRLHYKSDPSTRQ